jgi:hypothetical protein
MANEIHTCFAGEFQLAGWSESHTGGCKVTFWLQSPDDLAAFRALTVRKGNIAGHRFMAALVEIGDNEKPIETAKPKETLGQYCSMAVSWCARPDFWEFLSTLHSQKVVSALHASEVLKELTGVISRKEYDSDESSKESFKRKIKEPYHRWTLARGKSVGI